MQYYIATPRISTSQTLNHTLIAQTYTQLQIDHTLATTYVSTPTENTTIIWDCFWKGASYPDFLKVKKYSFQINLECTRHQKVYFETSKKNILGQMKHYEAIKFLLKCQ